MYIYYTYPVYRVVILYTGYIYIRVTRLEVERDDMRAMTDANDRVECTETIKA